MIIDDEIFGTFVKEDGYVFCLEREHSLYGEYNEFFYTEEYSSL